MAKYSVHQDILENAMPLFFWEEFEDGLLLFQLYYTLEHKKSKKEIDQPDLNLMERLQDKSEQFPSTAFYLKNVSINTFPNLVESLPRRVKALIVAKEGAVHGKHLYTLSCTGRIVKLSAER